MPATGSEMDVPRHRGIDIVSELPPLPAWLAEGVPGLPGGPDPWGRPLLEPWLGDPAAQRPELDALVLATPVATARPCAEPCGAWEPSSPSATEVAAGVGGAHPFAAPDPRTLVRDEALARDTGLRGPGETGDRVGVFLHSGEPYVHAVDLVVGGRGFDWRLERRWRGGAAIQGALGHGWSLSFERRMVRVDDTNLGTIDPGLFPIESGDWLRLDGYGRVDRYAVIPGAATTWRSPPGFHTTLVASDDGGLVERDRRGVVARYLPPDGQGVARLSTLADRHGNTMTFRYDGSSRLVAIEDTFGRTMTLRWGVELPVPLLAEVEDHAGRIVRYEYDAQRRLTGVIGPRSAAGPGAFEQPIVRRYEYDAFADGAGIHRLRRVSEPAFDEFGLLPTRARLDWSPGGRLVAFTFGPEDAARPGGGTIRYTRGPGEDGADSVMGVLDENGRRVDYGLDPDGRMVWRKVHADRDLDPEAPEHWITRYEYGALGQVLAVHRPEGNSLRWGYAEGLDTLAAGDVVRQSHHADGVRGGSQSVVTTTWTYDPVYRRVVGVTFPRGHDPDFSPSVGASMSPGRYSITRTLDYQEGMDVFALAAEAGLSPPEMRQRLDAAGMELDLGDVNGDGRIDARAGDAVVVRWPDVALREDDPWAARYGEARQVVESRIVWDDVGRPVAWTDPEGNRTRIEFMPENDPEGDGRDHLDGRGNAPLGLPAARVRDADPEAPPGPSPTASPSPPATVPPPTATAGPTDTATVPAPTATVAPASPTPDASATPETSATPGATPTPGGPSPTTPAASATPQASLTPPIGGPTPTVGDGSTIFLPYTENEAPTTLESADAADGATGAGGSHAAQAAAMAQGPTPIALPRNGGEGGDYLAVRESFGYDRIGRPRRWVDGRGVAHERRLDAAGGVQVMIRALDVSEAIARSEQGAAPPNWSGCVDAALPECEAMTAYAHQIRFWRNADGLPVRREVDHFGAPTDYAPEVLAPITVVDQRDYDPLGRVVEERRRMRAEPPQDMVARLSYDRAGNAILLRSPIATLADTDPLRQPAAVTAWVYDPLDRPARVTTGGLPDGFAQRAGHGWLSASVVAAINADPAALPVTEDWRYDGNGNARLHTHAVDRNGDGRPESTHYAYDGFDRLISVIDAAGGQELREHDPEGRLVTTSRYGPSGGPSPLTNAAATFDPPFVHARMNQALLERSRFDHDELGRLIARRDWLGSYTDVLYVRAPALRDGPLGTPGDGWISTHWHYDRASRASHVVLDDGAVTAYAHDGLHRLVRKEDAEGGERRWAWDGAGLLRTHAERWTPRPRDLVLGRMPETELSRITALTYDALGRPVRAVDGLGEAVRWSWDSLDRLVGIYDARHDGADAQRIADPLGQLTSLRTTSGELLPTARLTRPGNETAFAWDAAGRRVGEMRWLRADGTASGPLEAGQEPNRDGRVAVDFAWDPNGRLVAQADDGTTTGDDNDTPGWIERPFDAARGNVTQRSYDVHGRHVGTVRADGGRLAYTWDPDGVLRASVDANGTRVERVLDVLGRATRLQITPGTSELPHPAGGARRGEVTWAVTGTRTVRYEWDGLDRLTSAVAEQPGDVAGAPARRMVVNLARDTIGRVVEERAGDLILSREFAGRGTRIGLVHPDGTRLRDRRDRLGRLEERELVGTASNEPPLVRYAWFGPLVAEALRSDGSRATLLLPDLVPDAEAQRLAGLDPIGRVVAVDTRGPAGTPVLAVSRTFEVGGLVATRGSRPGGGTGTAFAYDSLGRVTGIAPSGDASGPFEPLRLDGAGNRVSVGDAPWQADGVHAYVAVDGLARAHDDNGNVVRDNRFTYHWDYADRLVAVDRAADGARVARYRYDAFGRLAGRIIYDVDGVPRDIVHLNDARDVVEDRDGQRLRMLRRYYYGRSSGAPRVHAYGSGLDHDERAALSAIDVVLDGDGVADDRFLVHLDPRGDLLALTARRVELDDEEREIPRMELIGRASVGPWGEPRGELLPGDIAHRFAGMPVDPETGLYRHESGRLYDPALGRWLQPDAAGGWAEPWELGNPYAFAGHRPALGDGMRGVWAPVVVPPETRVAIVRAPAAWPRDAGPGMADAHVAAPSTANGFRDADPRLGLPVTGTR